MRQCGGRALLRVRVRRRGSALGALALVVLCCCRDDLLCGVCQVETKL